MELLKIIFLKYIFKKFLPPNICDPNFCPPIFMTSLRPCWQAILKLLSLSVYCLFHVIYLQHNTIGLRLIFDISPFFLVGCMPIQFRSTLSLLDIADAIMYYWAMNLPKVLCVTARARDSNLRPSGRKTPNPTTEPRPPIIYHLLYRI